VFARQRRTRHLGLCMHVAILVSMARRVDAGLRGWRGRHVEYVREAAGRVRGGALTSKLRLTRESSFSSVNVCVASS
jgi:hypothetical protein